MSDTKTPDLKAIARKVIGKLNSDQHKLVNKWCMKRHNTNVPAFLMEAPERDAKVLLVEIDKAQETDNWTFFEPAANNPSKGQAVRTTDLKGDDDNTDDDEETEVETAEKDIPKQDGRGVPASRIPEDDDEEDEEEDDPEEDADEPVPATKTAAAPAPGDPLAGFVDAVADRVIAKMGKAQGVNWKEIDKHLQNGGFPVKRVDEMLDERQVQTIVNFLKSQPSELVDRAIEIYEA
jgi:hypothetical protein